MVSPEKTPSENPSSQPAQVLVVGAGPVGLILACDLAWRGVKVRIVESNLGPSKFSKAVGVFPRTLELLENHGVSEETVRCGVQVRGINIHADERRLAHIDASLIESRYNFVLLLEQSETERIFINRLAQLGVQVEWGTRFISLENQPSHVAATLERQDETRETSIFDWVVGCDGARSTVRKTLGVAFEGKKYSEAFNLADVELRGAPAEMKDNVSFFFSGSGVVFVSPLAHDRHRLIIEEAPGSADEVKDALTLEEFQTFWQERVKYPGAKDAKLTHDVWRSRFTIQQRLAEKLWQGRTLLAGDAAHIHSPVGAQGMNGGIHDALNLAWKLTLVIQGRAKELLLESYAQERLPFARNVLKFTDLATKGATLRSPVGRALRNAVLPLVANRKSFQKRMVNVFAGIFTHYQGSPLVLSHQKGQGFINNLQQLLKWQAPPTGGSRAPDVQLASGASLYTFFNHPHHTLLLFIGHSADDDSTQTVLELTKFIKANYGGLIRTVIVTPQAAPRLPGELLLEDTTGNVQTRYGRKQGGVCLIRPDRYVAFNEPSFETATLLEVLGRVFSGVTNKVSV